MANETANLKVQIIITGSVVGADGLAQTISIDKTYLWTDGTGSNQLGTAFYDASRALATTNEDIDVTGSATYTSLGAALDMNAVGLIYLENLDTDTGDKFTITQPAANGVPGIFKAASDGIDVGPGGVFLWISPIDKATVTAGTGDLINVASADNSNYKILIAGDNA